MNIVKYLEKVESLNEGVDPQIKKYLGEAQKMLQKAASLIKRAEVGEKFKDEMSDILNQVSQLKARF